MLAPDGDQLEIMLAPDVDQLEIMLAPDVDQLEIMLERDLIGDITVDQPHLMDELTVGVDREEQIVFEGAAVCGLGEDPLKHWCLVVRSFKILKYNFRRKHSILFRRKHLSLLAIAGKTNDEGYL